MDFISILSIFVLACFVGYYVVWSVTPALHTPLMAVTNAISSVIIVGARLFEHGVEVRRKFAPVPCGPVVEPLFEIGFERHRRADSVLFSSHSVDAP